jgi:hypothetical protein
MIERYFGVDATDQHSNVAPFGLDDFVEEKVAVGIFVCLVFNGVLALQKYVEPPKDAVVGTVCGHVVNLYYNSIL